MTETDVGNYFAHAGQTMAPGSKDSKVNAAHRPLLDITKSGESTALSNLKSMSNPSESPLCRFITSDVSCFSQSDVKMFNQLRKTLFFSLTKWEIKLKTARVPSTPTPTSHSLKEVDVDVVVQ